MQVGEMAGIAVGATVMLNILIAGYVPTQHLCFPQTIPSLQTCFDIYMYPTITNYHIIAIIYIGPVWIRTKEHIFEVYLLKKALKKLR